MRIGRRRASTVSRMKGLWRMSNPTGRRAGDNYKLQLLNRSRSTRGEDYLFILPTDVSSNPVTSPEFEDFSNSQLINEENELRKPLLKDPTNQEIRDRMNDINIEQTVRAQFLSQELSGEFGGMSQEVPQAILDRTAELNKHSDQYFNCFAYS